MCRPSRSLLLLVILGCSAVFAAAPAKLDKKEAVENSQRLDTFGDPLPDGAKSRLGTLRFRHDGVIEALAYSPDGKWIAALSDANCVCVWDVATGKKRHEFRPEGEEESWNSVLAFSADGTKLTIVGNEGQVQRWDLTSGKKASSWRKEDIDVMAFSSDGETFLYLNDAEGDENKTCLYLLETATGKRLRTLEMKDDALVESDDDGSLAGIAVSRDLRILAIREHAGIRVRDLKKDKELPFIKIKEEEAALALGLAISPDNKYLVAAESEERIGVWNINTGKRVKSWKSGGEIRSLTLSPDGKLLAVVEGDGTKVRDFSTGKTLRTLKTSGRVFFSPDGKTLASGIGGQGITLFDLATGQAFPAGHPGMVTGLALTPDGKTIFTAGGFGLVVRGDVEGAGDGEARRWDVGTGKAIATFKYEGAVVGLGYTEAGRLLACLHNNADAVRLMELESNKELARWDLLEQNLLSPNGKTMARKDDEGRIAIYDVAAGKDVLNFQPGDDVQFLALSWDGKFLAGEGLETGNLYLWDTSTGKSLQRFSLRQSNEEEMEAKEDYGIGSIGALSPDGRILARGGDSGTISFWELATHKEIHQQKGHQGMISALAFSADGRTLVSGSADTTALVWDVAEVFQGNERSQLSTLKMDDLWQRLDGVDAGKAYQAFCALAASPDQALALLKKRLRVAPKMDESKIRASITNLSDNQFAVREQARKDLEELGELAEPLMRQALGGKVDPEAKRRLENLLGYLDAPVLPPHLGTYRAVGVLEQIGTAQAKELLIALAQGAPGARQTKDAKEALARLAKRPTEGMKITSR